MRLKDFNYSSHGAYFITICTKDKQPILSEIIISNDTGYAVGDGALDIPFIKLTSIGKTVEKYLLSTENISGVKIDRYVIMPDHIHIIIFLNPDEYKKHNSRILPPNEMLPHVISTFKRFCNKEIGYNIFQRSYMEHVIRDFEDYETRSKYIYENPIRRYSQNLND